MAYDDSRFRGEPGFRDEPGFRSHVGVSEDAEGYAAGAYPVNGNGAQSSENTIALNRRTPSPAQLDDVFDDPAHGEPGRDRMAVHALWELVLLLGVAGMVYLLRLAQPAALQGNGLRGLFLTTTVLGLVTVGMALSLRAAAPNLALGPVTYAAALFFASNSARGLLPTAVVTVLLALGVGLLIAAIVVAFHLPGWAVSLAAAMALIVWIERQRGSIEVVAGAYRPDSHAMYWVIGFAGLSVLGGLFGLVKPIRRAVGRFRPVADPARRRGAPAAIYTAVAICVSSVLAGGAGVLLALYTRTVGPTENGLALTGLALGAALLGGTSIFGRRGGVFGTVFAVALVSTFNTYTTVKDWRVSTLAVAAAVVVLGLLVSRLIETFGRPRSAVDQADEDQGWVSNRSDQTGWGGDAGWGAGASAPPAEPVWSGEERWGAR
jgi:ribose/xylose/arabinose/galactoside ABC-type transport system permease subunit